MRSSSAATHNGVPRVFLVEMDYEQRAGGRRLRVHRAARGLDRVGVIGRRVLLEGRARREAGAMNSIVEVEGIARSFGETRALAGVDVSVPEGGVRRPARAQRRGQDHPHPHLVDADRTRRRHRDRRRVRRGEATDRGAPLDRPRRSVRGGRRDAHRTREPRDGRPALAAVEVVGRGARRRSARPREPHRRRRPAAQDVLRRHAASHRPRRRPRRRAHGYCCSTSRPPGSIRPTGSTCGRSSATSSTRAPPSSSPRSTSRRRTNWPRTWSSLTTGS